MYDMMIVSIQVFLIAIFRAFRVFHFILIFLFQRHREYPLVFRLVLYMEFVGVLVYRQTMAFIQIPRPIMVISAECICGLMLSILGRFEGVHI